MNILKIWSYFGDATVNIIETKSVIDKKFVFAGVLGVRFAVQIWRDVAVINLNGIVENDAELFLEIAGEYPRFVTRNMKELSEPRKLNDDYFVEVHLSAHAINRFCRQAIEIIDFTNEDWRVETQ